MITYHPFYDVDHTIFRFLALLERAKGSVELERLQLYDFFIIFPHILSDISLPHHPSRRVRSFLQELPKPYQRLPDRKALFRRGALIQHQAARLLIAGGVINASDEHQASLARTDLELDEPVTRRIFDFYERKVIEFHIIDELRDIPVHGPKGLKARSNLLEYAYDASIK